MVRATRRLALSLGIAAGSLALAVPVAAQTPQHLDPQVLSELDDAQLHGTVTPPGSDTRHATTELAAYDDLVRGYPTLTDEELRNRYFKQRLFGPIADPQRTYNPRADVTVVRDAKWGEPHIFGETDEAMAFGAGYVAAEDRLAIMEILRAVGRGEAFQVLGTAPAWLADAEAARLYGYTEEEFQAQIDRLPAVYGQAGRDVVAMLEAYVEGVNEYIAASGRGEVPLPAGFADLGLGAPGPWKMTDVVAAVSTVRALFGAGGGAELRNAAVLARLVSDFGPANGRAIYDDFRNRDNADGPVHTRTRFPYMQRDEAQLDPRAMPTEQLVRGASRASVRELDRLAERSRIRTERLKLSTPLGGIDLSRPGSMSNHLVVGASRSATGNPILLGGPQAAYFSPQILMDYELHSPTIHARGAGFPGLSTLVIMGRTQDYAWTPTAGGSDMVDTYVEKLCNPDGGPVTEDSRHYEFRGECRAMERRTLRRSEEAPALLEPIVPDIVVERTVHGPVTARGTLGGRPVAISSKRSTYMKELDSAVSILKMNRNEAATGSQFVDIFRESHNLSTNWSYANARQIAYVHGGLYPRRPASVDPDFPVWGTGEWEWATDGSGNDVYLGRADVPHQVAPKRDYFVSWNNRPAPDWGSADSQWGHSSLYRADLLEDAILRARGRIDPVELVQMMEEAGLTDLRGRYVAPLALRVLERAPAVSERERKMIALLREWVDEGALRRDGDGNGDYDRSAAVAIMDAWWERLIRAVYDPVVGDASRIPIGFDNAPGPTGSAYQDGFYGYLWTDLSMALGEPVRSPTSRIYCGGTRDASGTLESCAERVLASLVAAGDSLASSQRTSDPAAWKSDAQRERIRFLPAAALSMHWVNRPTTQQIAMFGRDSCGDVTAPVSRVRRRSLRASRRVVRVRGRSRDRGCERGRARVAGKVQRVYVSIAKVRGRSGRQCRFVGRDGRVQRKIRSCRRPVLHRARGTKRWRFAKRVRLPAGRYRLQVRAVDIARNKERPRKRANVSFTVR